MNKLYLLLPLFAVLFAACKPKAALIGQDNVNILPEDSKNYPVYNDATPSVTLTPTSSATPFPKGQKLFATLKTNYGNIKIELTPDKTPITTANFVDLAQGTKLNPVTGLKVSDKPYYDGIIFHRVIKGFMIQGGDPLGTGTGGPGYQFDDEPFTGEYTRGTVAMANAGPNTNGSQFFIMHEDYPLPPNYVIFGHVVSGIETVDAIANLPTNSQDKPTTEAKILKVTISDK